MSVLETARLRLRKAAPSDLDAIWNNVWQDESIARWMFWPPTATHEDAASRLERTIAFQAMHKYVYFVCLKDTDEAIGFAGMREIEPGVYEESGVCVASRYQLNGLGTEILEALVDLAFTQLHARCFIAAHIRENEKSRAVISHCGFHYTHSKDEIREWDGKPLTVFYYRLDRTDYLKKKT